MSDPTSSNSCWSSRAYYACGALAGMTEGVCITASAELQQRWGIAGENAHVALISAQEATENFGCKLIHGCYITSGAIAGLLTGSKYAYDNLKVWLLEDEITLHLLNPAPSPVKYTFPADFRIKTGGRSASRISSSGSKASSRSSSISPREYMHTRGSHSALFGMAEMSPASETST